MTARLSRLKRQGNWATAHRPLLDKKDGANTLSPNNRKEDRADEKCSASPGLCPKLYFSPYYHDNDWRPSLSEIFKMLFSFRMAATIFSIISDCDEVYNYWEPLHLLSFGRGFQTWEYSPVYAIRSWFYICIHYIPVHGITSIISLPTKISFFYAVRSFIALISITAEVCLYESICKRLGNKIGLFYSVFSLFSVGMFGASCAFLPSSFSMALNIFAMAAYLQKQWFLSILCTVISAVVGWPFAAVLGLPIVVEMLILRRRTLAVKFFGYSLLCGVLIVSPLFLIDSYFYGKRVLAPLNIVLYNIFTSHGPELYGVEPASFYAKNLFLNWNVVLLFVVLAVPTSLYVYICNNDTSDSKQNLIKKIEFSLNFWDRYLPVLLIFLSTALWLVIFTAQAHKEERFLFPIYPLIALLSAIGLDATLRMSRHLFFIGKLTMGLFVVISLSRGYAIHRNYSAAMDSYHALHNHLTADQNEMDFFQKEFEPIRTCVGKEWHRFPSSFFLPELMIDKRGRMRYVDLRFIQSEFRGLLPKHFVRGPLPNITRITPSAMNDQNQEEPSRYVPVESCDYLIDLVTGRTTKYEPDYAAKTDEFSVLFSKPFLIAENSHPFFRAFYLPFTNDRLHFGRYVVLKRK